MHWTVLGLISVLFTGLPETAACALAPGSSAAQAASSAASRVSSKITVTVPHAETELLVNGAPRASAGLSRTFDTPPLQRGTTHRYTFSARWQPNTYTTFTRTKSLSFRAGERVIVDLTVPDPTDRVVIKYVPTPREIAEHMVTLAGVTAADVVYEPGCGDARITIAAIRRGARRGICVDIDPARVEASRASVSKAGLAGRIDVRLGDALDVSDWSEATVVFLYMGDEFNLLLRPMLWKQLAVGSRVVSHRFTMGDWKPDKTIRVPGPGGGEYPLHLWTVTEELKRAAAGR